MEILIENEMGKIFVKSLWNQEITIPARKPMQNDMNVQIAVIGAGMTGILTAYLLQKKGLEVIVLEADQIAGGQTQNTTAKITSQHGFCYHNMICKIGSEKAEAYAWAHESAIADYEKIIKEENIDCQFVRLPSYLYTTKEENLEKLKKEEKAAKSLGIQARFIEGEIIKELPFRIKGAVCFEKQAQFQPLIFVKHLAKKIEIYEKTKVLSVRSHTIYTDKGKVNAEYIIFACHYPFPIVPGFYFLRQHQERSYVLALKKQRVLSGMYYSMDKNGVSLRSADSYLLLGGGNHRTGKKIDCQNEEYGYSFLKKKRLEYFPYSKIDYAWSAQDCMSHDEIPFIGKYSVLRPYWYVATGFKKWGMTSAMVAANVISMQIYKEYTGFVVPKEHVGYLDFAKLLTPQRCFFRAGIKNLLVDIGESISGLTKRLFSKRRKKCRHMGCKLEWNPEEKSWDCPCHGSRFSEDGEVLDEPAQTSLK